MVKLVSKRSILLRLFVMATLLISFIPVFQASAATAGYVKQELATGLNAPVNLDRATDGRIFFVERTTGNIKVFHPSTSLTTLSVKINVFGNIEDGLMGIALDPNFATNNWLYIYYSPAGTVAENRISRFNVNGDNVDLASEKILLRVPTQRAECCHSAGDLEFGPDGNLYLSVGDNTNPFASNGFSPIDEQPGRSAWDAQKSASNMNDLRGKILRITPQSNGTYTVPSGNLFPNGVGGKPEIYIMGNRNPYRVTVNPYNNTLYWGEVGPDSSVDDANRGPMGYDEINAATSAGNYGWPYCIANNQAYREYNFANSTSGPAYNCNAPINNSPNNTGGQNLPPARSAMIWYPYGHSAQFPELDSTNGGRTAAVASVYKYDAANTNPNKFPASLDKSLIIFDFSRFWFKEVQFDAGGNLLKINPFLASLSFDHPIASKIGKDGIMYVIEYASGGVDGKLSRVYYNSGGNSAPNVVASANKTSGLAPLAVNFSTAGTTDPEGDPMTFAWDFDGNGTTDSTSANPSFTYTTNGTFNAKVTVTDNHSASASVVIPITVGNNAPVVTITSPAAGGFYKWGDTISYTVTVTDVQDGAIDCTKVTVLPALGHDTHSHPGNVQSGCSGSFQTVISDTNVENTYYLITASYTDKGGLLGTATLKYLSKDRQAEFFDSSNGAIQIENTTDTGGGKNVGFISNGNWLSYKAVNLVNMTGISARVASAGAGGTIEMHADSATGTLLSTMTVPVTGGWQTWTTVNGTISNKPTGQHDIYFVFKGGAGNLFNVNRFDFVGTGISSPPVQGTVVSLKANANGQFVSSVNTGDQLIANRTTVGPGEQFDLITLPNGNVNLRSKWNSMYVSADNAGANPLVANRAAAGPWEEFTKVDAGGGQVAFKAVVNGKYVTAENAGAAALIARSATIGAWEKYTLN